MADLFYTILVLWILWKIFGSTAVSAFQKSAPQPPLHREGDVTISSAPKPDKNKDSDRGEYVDFEEVK
jgi:hypothetical protein